MKSVYDTDKLAGILRKGCGEVSCGELLKCHVNFLQFNAKLLELEDYTLVSRALYILCFYVFDSFNLHNINMFEDKSIQI